jgi:alpha-D-ribose 1-methylphosphonate 5-triphosphate diphosphatase
MTRHLPSLRLTGATVLRDAALHQTSISLHHGVLSDDLLTEVDLTGYLILPGIIDLHGDGFERHMSPRPGAPFPLAAGLASYDREAAAAGITTAYLAQGWSWEGGHRGPDHAEALAAALDAYRPQALTDMRLQMRVETHLLGQSDRLLAMLARHDIDYVVFNDHLEEGNRMARQNPEGFGLWARKLGVNGRELLARLEKAQASARLVPRSLCHLAQEFDRLGVHYGSHDDPDAETREFYAMIGARIAEFPTTRRAATAAHLAGDPVLMGAPNVVRGGSQSGNIAASSLIAEDLCDALVSDYHLPALPLAAWEMVDQGLCDLARAWAMISSNPARVLRMADRGRIAPGLRADLVIVNAESRVIEATIANGVLTHLSGEAARRFLTPVMGLRLAAE